MIKLTADEAIYERISICASCDANMFGICAKCGCIIQAKIRIANASCPLGKWSASTTGTGSVTKEEDR